jgi:hypothetical protein
MIELAEYARRMVAQTGLGKDDSEMFPGFPQLRTSDNGQAKRAAR